MVRVDVDPGRMTTQTTIMVITIPSNYLLLLFSGSSLDSCSRFQWEEGRFTNVGYYLVLFDLFISVPNIQNLARPPYHACPNHPDPLPPPHTHFLPIYTQHGSPSLSSLPPHCILFKFFWFCFYSTFNYLAASS